MWRGRVGGKSLLQDPPAETSADEAGVTGGASSGGERIGSSMANAAGSVAVHMRCALTIIFAFVVSVALF